MALSTSGITGGPNKDNVIQMEVRFKIVFDVSHSLNHLSVPPLGTISRAICRFVFLKELIKDLQTAKRQTWEERERLSERFDEERRVNLSNKVLTNDGL